MNLLDWLLGLTLAYSVVRAAMRGLTRTALSFAGLICGLLLACWNYQRFSAYLNGFIASLAVAEFCAFALILLAALLVAGLLAATLRRTLSAVGLSFADQLGGAAFGLLRGVLLAGTILLALTALAPSSSWLQTSLLAPYLIRSAHAVSFLMPTDLTERLLNGANNLKHTAPHWIK